MINTVKTLLLILVITAGCSQQSQQTSLQTQRKFFTPRNWQVPITTTEAPSSKNVTEDTEEPQLPDEERVEYKEKPQTPDEQMIGYASWYGPGFHGKKTANGEEYDQDKMTAAHKLLPMNTWLKVTNMENNKTVVVRINDRGPYKKNRIIDLTRKAAEELGFEDQGTARVSLEILRLPDDYNPSKGLDPYKQVVIQIAVFSTQERADSFKQKLEQKYSKLPFMIEAKNEKFYVLAGPYDEKDGAKQISDNLKDDGINNFVRSYKK
ncbi:septal ring lytic transglycosylase RlpA family protein [bacterium]|nr:septal ring lytic transglycosylase RlpA family protein [bacterium]